MGKYISVALAIFFSGMLTPIIMNAVKKSQIKKESRMNEKDFIIAHSNGWIWFILIGLAVLTTILMLLNIFDGFPTELQFWATNLTVIPLVIFFIFGAFGMARKKLIVKNDNIYYTPILGKKKHFTFSDITKLKEKVLNSRGTLLYYYVVFTTKKICSIVDSMLGSNLFLQIVREKGICIETIDEQHKKRKESRKR